MPEWTPHFDWLKAEESWKGLIGEDLRSAILKITVEIAGNPYGEADAKTRQHAADQLLDLARRVRKLRSALNYKTPVASYARALLKKSLASELIKNEDGETISVEELEDALDPFEQACVLARLEALDPARLSPSEAWGKWTVLLFEQMFMNKRLKYGDGSRFIGVVYELQKALPQELKRHVQSFEALDKAIRRKFGRKLSPRMQG
jgi:hypothetical protein